MPMHENTGRALHDGRVRCKADRKAGAERNASIVAVRKNGATFAECGRRFGVSATRVRQICAKAALRDAE